MRARAVLWLFVLGAGSVGFGSCRQATEPAQQIAMPDAMAADAQLHPDSHRDAATDASRPAVPITALSAGAAHACATTGPDVYCWGRNTHGEIPGVPDHPVLTPVRLLLTSEPSSVRAGGASKETGHTCALRQGTVWCSGANDYGQLGDGTRTPASTPVQTLDLSDAVAIELGSSHTCALRGNGSVACWGRGDSGQLGTGKLTDEPRPTAVVGLSEASGLSVGFYHGCATRTDGPVCWGANTYGELGRGDRILSATPVPVSGLGPVRSIAAGGFASCALTVDGRASCWGSNEYGQLGTGDGDSGAFKVLPALVGSLERVAELSLGGSHTCARVETGTAYCWGANTLGQLGDGTRSAHDAPTAVSGLAAVQRIEAGTGFTLAADARAGLVAFGANDEGQLGDGTRIARAAPGPVLLP